MRTVLVVCGAGASSTFLALAMRSRCAQRGIELRPVAVDESTLPQRLSDADAVLVGRHLAARFPQLRDEAAERGVPAVLLADGDVGAAGAEHAITAVLAVLDGSTGPDAPKSSPTPATTTRTE